MHLRSHNSQNKINKMLILPLFVGPLLIHGLMRLFILYEIPDAAVTLTGLIVRRGDSSQKSIIIIVS